MQYTTTTPIQGKFANEILDEGIKNQFKTYAFQNTSEGKPRLLWPGTIVETEDAEFTVVSTLHNTLDPKYPV